MVIVGANVLGLSINKLYTVAVLLKLVDWATEDTLPKSIASVTVEETVLVVVVKVEPELLPRLILVTILFELVSPAL